MLAAGGKLIGIVCHQSRSSTAFSPLIRGHRAARISAAPTPVALLDEKCSITSQPISKCPKVILDFILGWSLIFLNKVRYALEEKQAQDMH